MEIRLEQEQPIKWKRDDLKNIKRIFFRVPYKESAMILAFISILLSTPWNILGQNLLFVFIKFLFICLFLGLFIRVFYELRPAFKDYCKRMEESGKRLTTAFASFDDIGFKVGKSDLCSKQYVWDSVTSYKISKNSLLITATGDTFSFSVDAFTDSQLNELSGKLKTLRNYSL